MKMSTKKTSKLKWTNVLVISTINGHKEEEKCENENLKKKNQKKTELWSSNVPVYQRLMKKEKKISAKLDVACQ